MNHRSVLIDFALKEWLLLISGISLAASSVYLGKPPSWSAGEWQVLFILFVLFITVNGLQQSGLITRLSRGIEKGRAVPLKLVVLTFFLSMLVTNDIALVVVVPLTLLLDIDRKDVLVILEALAANAGSALTPFGNPQNLFIYWFYDLQPLQFVTSIAPFSLFFLVVLAVSAIFIKTVNGASGDAGAHPVSRSARVYGAFLVLVLLTVLHILPVMAGVIVIIFALVFDRKALAIDYALIVTFFFFFGLAENMKILLAYELTHHGHIFLLSAIASQFISNVPAALLFAKFTPHWDALLWGVNTGGFGSLLGSLANLIAYRIYVTHESTNNTGMFTVKFLVAGFIAFFLSLGLYFLLYRI